jgi:hypothetical protein
MRQGRKGRKTAPLLLALAALGLGLPGRAQAAETGIAATAGTLGGGVELTFGLSRQVDARLGAHAFNYSERREASDIEYDAKARARTATAFLDWHPGGGGFRLTGGLVYNATDVKGSSIPPASGNYLIGGVAVPVSLLGTLDGKVDFDPVAPYAGLGWGTPLGSGRSWGLTLDAGAMFQGRGNVTLTPRIPAGSPLNNPTARQALQILIDREERDVEHDISDYDIYPVVSVGVSYRF